MERAFPFRNLACFSFLLVEHLGTSTLALISELTIAHMYYTFDLTIHHIFDPINFLVDKRKTLSQIYMVI